MEETCRLIELGPVPVIYADVIANAVSNGETARITYAERRLHDRGWIWVPVCEIVRPMNTIRPGLVMDLIARAEKATRELVPLH